MRSSRLSEAVFPALCMKPAILGIWAALQGPKVLGARKGRQYTPKVIPHGGGGGCRFQMGAI